MSGTADYTFVGMWVTADGRIRHELLPNGRYKGFTQHRCYQPLSKRGA